MPQSPRGVKGAGGWTTGVDTSGLICLLAWCTGIPLGCGIRPPTNFGGSEGHGVSSAFGLVGQGAHVSHPLPTVCSLLLARQSCRGAPLPGPSFKRCQAPFPEWCLAPTPPGHPRGTRGLTVTPHPSGGPCELLDGAGQGPRDGVGRTRTYRRPCGHGSRFLENLLSGKAGEHGRMESEAASRGRPNDARRPTPEQGCPAPQ